MELLNYNNSNDNTIIVSESNYSISKNNDTNKGYIEDKKRQLLLIEQYEKELNLQAKQNQLKAQQDISRQQKEYEKKEKYDRINEQKKNYENFVHYKEYDILNNKIKNIFHHNSSGNFDQISNLIPIFDNRWKFPKNTYDNRFNYKLADLQRIPKKEEIENKTKLNQKSYKSIRSKSENKYIKNSANTSKSTLKKSTKFIEDNKLKRSNTVMTQRNKKNKNDVNKSFSVNKSINKNINSINKISKTLNTDKRSKTAKYFYKKNKINDNEKKQKIIYFNKRKNFNNNLMNVLSDRKQQTENNKNYEEINRTDFRKYMDKQNYLSSNDLSNNRTTYMTSDRFFSNKKYNVFEDKKREELYHNAFRRCNYKKSFRSDNNLINPKTSPKIIKTERNFFHHKF